MQLTGIRPAQVQDTGRPEPETSKEFAQRMKGKFILRGPRKRTEGENGSKLPITLVTEPVAGQRTDDHIDADVDRDVTQSATEADLPSEPDPDTGTSLINVLKLVHVAGNPWVTRH